ncbi:MAG: putative arabinose efflux permease, family, partial [Actinomycetia bacterium]|nr:putative arabinose efflux permease, family [Actinomycetes bacterium]
SLGPVGAALLTWAAAHFGVMAACLASGAACLVIGTAALLTPIRRRGTRPGVAAAET